MDDNRAPDAASRASQLTEPTQDGFDEFLRQAAGTSEPAAEWPERTLQVGRVLSGSRLEVLRVIGAGGMGVVHEAFDRERGCKVALKTLLHPDPAGIYLLKNEFRSLADLSHPSLVRLHQLFCDDDLWFFTMELVEGQHFDTWVRPDGVLDQARLRDALNQLVSAVASIHAADKVHRDLKPSNVLVTAEGRLRVLDFGLAVSLDRAYGRERSLRAGVSGTPAYMSPEQASGGPDETAGDCYAIGVMLFEALTGGLPFVGEVHEVMHAKVERDAPAACDIVPTVPADLDLLCRRLLSRDPAARPNAQALEGWLARSEADVAQVASSSELPRAEALLVGRDFELAELRAAYRATLAGTAVAVFVSGESGIGKSSLLRTFLAEVRGAGAVLTLEGRCYERESVPYKALDPFIDDLSRYLEHLNADDALALLPRDVFALTRLFPVLNRVSSIARASKNTIADLQELRRRGFSAFHELIHLISARRPLVVCIDDLQWIDGDSTAFLRYLLGESRPVNAMIVLCARSAPGGRDDALAAILEASRSNPKLETRSLAIGPLSTTATQALAQRLLGSDSQPVAARISQESQGSPFFLQQLCRQVREGGTSLTLQGALAEHLERLTPGARGLLEVIATAGRPVREAIAIGAAHAQHDSIDELRLEQLIRSSTHANARTLECYHDKIRENVVASFAPAGLRAVHQRLLGALRAQPEVDPEQFAIHAEGAGEFETAGHYAVVAGDAAHAQLAFARAADLYRGALNRLRLTPAKRSEVELKLAVALSDAGRGAEAAPIFHHAANQATPSAALEWRRRAAEQWLVSGRAEEGLRAFADILEAVGLKFPKSPRIAFFDLLRTRFLLRLRGLSFEQRSAHDLPAAVLLRIDACKTAWALSFVSTIRAAAFQARHLLYALRAGEPYRISLGLCMEAIYVSLSGVRYEKRAHSLLAAARELSAGIDNPHANAFLLLAAGQTSYMLGRYEAASDSFAAAERLLTETCSNVTWELNSTRFFWGNALEFRGRLKELHGHLGVWLQDADTRGDLYASATLELLRARWMLANGDIAAVRETMRQAMGRWKADEFGVQQFLAAITAVQADLYQGDPATASERLREMWPQFSRSLMSQIQICRIPAHQHSAYVALAMAAQYPRDRRWIRKAASHRRALRRERTPLADAFALQISAAIAHLHGKQAAALRELRVAADALDAVNLHLYAAANRRRLAALSASDLGRRLMSDVDALLLEQGVAEPSAFARMLAPGFASSL